MDTIYKKPLDIYKKDCMIDKYEFIKVPMSKEEIIKLLKIMKGFQRILQEAIK